MNKWIEYITNPARIVSFCVFIFSIWVAYATINSRINVLEEFKAEVNIVWIQKDIQEIKTNVAWIMNDLQSKK